ncbi:MAG: NAD(P)H-dependent oxidoreductase subunit E [Rubrivivax sp.]|jgi:[NiFe] hydrogenase diaphorase moiety large subunit|nr:NAD(P)H-dependent oxidoreductase subunit E [Rubrivivax sp.]
MWVSPAHGMPVALAATTPAPQVADVVACAVRRHRRRPDRLLQILRDVQDELHWLSDNTLQRVADALGISCAQAHSTRDFYSFLYRQPRGRWRVLFSDNITDRMLGNQALYQQLLQHWRLEPGVVSADGRVSVALTSCTGLCDQGPALLVNERAITRLTPERVEHIAALIDADVPLHAWPAAFFQVDNPIRRADRLLGAPYVAGQALRAAVARGRQGMLDEMALSRLRGRGGAGFSTALKWQACRDAPGDQRVIVCNADEGEPGTFKDRVLLQAFAGRVLEGMAIAAYVVGAQRGVLYLRAEYRYLRRPLLDEIDRLRSANCLGRQVAGVPGFDLDIEIHLGAGAYVCGEETALIESLEGKAGRPRIRPPYPVTQGYQGLPTVVNNVETLCRAAEIALHGGAWYAAVGTAQSTGTQILSVSGDVDRPGLYEYPFGVTIHQVLADCGAHAPKAVQVSGAAGRCLSSSAFGRRIAFEDVATAGSFMVFGQGRDMVELALNVAHFFAHESCGFCTPCRSGTALVADTMDKIASGRGTPHDLHELLKLQAVMKATSHCGLGQTAGDTVVDVMQSFRADVDRYLGEGDVQPAFDLHQATEGARQAVGRAQEAPVR